jgi:hypothetical protein
MKSTVTLFVSLVFLASVSLLDAAENHDEAMKVVPIVQNVPAVPVVLEDKSTNAGDGDEICFCDSDDLTRQFRLCRRGGKYEIPRTEVPFLRQTAEVDR